MTTVACRALTGALVLAIAVPSADAVTLCAKRSGRVVASARCARRDDPLTPADLGIVGVQGMMGAPGPTGPSGQVALRIVDANGHDVCRAVDDDAAPACVMTHPTLSRPVLLVFDSLPLEIGTGVGVDTVYYADSTCAGPPQLERARPLLPSASLVGHALYYATGMQSMIVPHSFERLDDPCTGTPTARGACCQPYTSMTGRLVAPAERVDLSDLGLTLPFSGVAP